MTKEQTRLNEALARADIMRRELENIRERLSRMDDEMIGYHEAITDLVDGYDKMLNQWKDEDDETKETETT